MDYDKHVNAKTLQTKHYKKNGALPLVSVITPAFNEAIILERNLDKLCTYLKELEDNYRWEIIIINDGSKDETGTLADQFAQNRTNVIVYHHKVNRNLGGALQTGFKIANGDYVVVMDLDLSYAEEHIGRLLAKIQETDADIVIASPYMKGGKSTGVPFFRLLLSRVVNRLMRFMSAKNIYTFTGMVRAYKGSFLKKLNLKSTTYSINPEIIQKAIILRASMVEIPGHLDWTLQNQEGNSRSSSIKIFRGINQGLMAGFIFRPYVFFMSVGLLLLLVSFYLIAGIFVNIAVLFSQLPGELIGFDARFSEALSLVFQEHPYAFIIGGISLIVSLQFLGIGFLSLQNKRYFDELFHINTTILNTHLNENQVALNPNHHSDKEVPVARGQKL